MLGVIYEDEAMAGGGLQAGDAGHGDGAVSEETAAELLGEIAQGLLHGCLLSLSGAGVYNAGVGTGLCPVQAGQSPASTQRGRISTAAAAPAGESSSGGAPRATGRDSGG